MEAVFEFEGHLGTLFGFLIEEIHSESTLVSNTIKPSRKDSNGSTIYSDTSTLNKAPMRNVWSQRLLHQKVNGP